MRLPGVVMLAALSACNGPDAGLPPAYRSLAVPAERLASPAARARGRELYRQHCALCHGERADGRGVRRSSLSSPPADFTRRRWREGTTPRRVFAVVREGVRGTPMPAWRQLDDEATWDLVAYLLSVAGEGP